MKLYVEEIYSNTFYEFKSEEIARKTIKKLDSTPFKLEGHRTTMWDGGYFNNWRDWKPSTHMYFIYSDLKYKDTIKYIDGKLEFKEPPWKSYRDCLKCTKAFIGQGIDNNVCNKCLQMNKP